MTAFIRELKQPRRRRQQKPHKFAYFTMKNSIFARFARAFFIFWHFVDVLVLSTTSNDLFCRCLDDASVWWQMFNFVFLCPKLWFQFNSRVVRTHFSREFKKLRRQLQRKRHIKIELCVKLSLLRLFYVDHVVKNRRTALSLACYEWFSCKGKECVTPRFKPFCCLEFPSVGKHRQLECQRHHHKLKFHWPNEEKQACGALGFSTVACRSLENTNEKLSHFKSWCQLGQTTIHI